MADEERNALLKILLEHRDTSLKHWEIMSDRMGLMEDSIVEIKQDVAATKAGLAENTEMTKVVAEAKVATRVVTKTISWIGAIMLAIGSIWWSVKEILGVNGNITPGP